MKKILLLFLPLLLGAWSAAGQVFNPSPGPVFNDSIVPRVDIIVPADTLQWIYAHVESNREWHAVFVFDNDVHRDTLKNVGFRLRGNTSRRSKKKSFKISFNTFVHGRKYHGLEKMNLNGEHNDPSVIRSKLCWDLLRHFELPAARANHVRVYINGKYYGLYINVEHIDEQFVKSRFGNRDGNLYKCLWPADLAYRGKDPDVYKFTSGGRRAYDLKTNKAKDDYSDLAHFIDVLDNTPDSAFLCAIQKVFNVYDYLKVIAFDVVTGNWDGYIYNKNNFYLYHNTATGKFEYIPYDLDNTFGIDWMGIDWARRNVYQWQKHGENVSRPLYSRIMANKVLRGQFSFYLKQFAEYMEGQQYDLYIDSLRNRIAPYVKDDPYYPLDYGYSYQDFVNSYSQSLGGHVPYGLKPYIATRTQTALQQLEKIAMAPVIKYIHHGPVFGKTIGVRARIDHNAPLKRLFLAYQVNGSAIIDSTMFDDGHHFDANAGDGVYGTFMPGLSPGDTLAYQIVGEDSAGNTSAMPCSPVKLSLKPSRHPKLYINEFMASNKKTITDNFGEYADWIEVFNGDDHPVWLGDKYLTDNLHNPGKWAMPDDTLAPGGFVLFWADNDEGQGAFHTNFKLSKSGEQIGIFDSPSTGFAVIDSLTFGGQKTDVSMGRLPDGGPQWVFFDHPTPGWSNVTTGMPVVKSPLLKVYPNPVAHGRLFLSRKANVSVYDITGRLVLQKQHVSVVKTAGLLPGPYFLVTDNGFKTKFIVR